MHLVIHLRGQRLPTACLGYLLLSTDPLQAVVSTPLQYYLTMNPLDRTLGAGAESSGGSQDCNALVLTTEATISVFSSALGVLLGEALEVLSEVDPSRVDMFCNPEW